MRVRHLIPFLVVLLTTLAALTPLATRSEAWPAYSVASRASVG
ncbi:MAG TPA: hypothetical protein VIJ28_00320 [Chloroflexota bacterium]